MKQSHARDCDVSDEPAATLGTKGHYRQDDENHTEKNYFSALRSPLTKNDDRQKDTILEESRKRMNDFNVQLVELRIYFSRKTKQLCPCGVYIVRKERNPADQMIF